ncbi:BRCA1-associated RING domain protein 1 [Lepeophtheirus salmonis]|uniref:BRCA1-associated RING domain protein 1 n=1 Tax=Lepeophtheirus salmonis TaxID=72036 RepID=UPI001AE66BD5|nr:BRCA1-associated RING domain protein 1-like [Lepeophtheirus salmonis]
METVESLSLSTSELNRILRCEKCLKVPPKTLWYIKKCSHTFCGSCLKENADNGQCMTCKTPYVQKRDLCIRHSTREAISVYHKLKLILNPDYVTLYLEVDPMESRKENKDKRTPIGKKSSQDTNLTPNTSKSRKKSLEEGGGKSIAVNMKSSTPKGRPLKEKKCAESEPKTPKSRRNSIVEQKVVEEADSILLKSNAKNAKENSFKKDVVSKKQKLDPDLLNSSITLNPTPSKSKSNINKRNVIGETPLHVACCKGDYDKVCELLGMGANPNNQDNAGWTPLHECAQKGYTNIAKVLLDKGAAPSVPGGPDNFTPLHDASYNGWKDVVFLLIKKGADKNAMDSLGRRPRDLSYSKEIMELVNSTLSELSESQVLVQTIGTSFEATKDYVLIYFESVKDINAQMRKLVKELDWKISNNFNEDVTHVIFSSCIMNLEGQYLLRDDCLLYFEAVLSAKKILPKEWFTKCIEAKTKVDTTDFLIKGTSNNPSFSLRQSILNSAKRLPRLFAGMHFNIHNSVTDKKGLSEIIKRGSGVILKREPDPECIPEAEKKIPYHVDPSGPLKSCSHYIIYQSGSKREPELKYDMSHIKTLPLDWLFSCIHKFSIVSPYGIS